MCVGRCVYVIDMRMSRVVLITLLIYPFEAGFLSQTQLTDMTSLARLLALTILCFGFQRLELQAGYYL